MKIGLPENNGLAASIISNPGLIPRENGEPSLTDVQYSALEAGVARDESILVSAPTSTGKTLIGWWAIASALAAGRRAVYLVSHRALAKQKFEEAQKLFLASSLDNDRSSIICATGDAVEDAFGRKTSAPLSAAILIATYEKFLGCLSTGGPPRDLSDITFVCDEVQLIGDKTRGQNVELLLTLLKRASWHQFVALSAVISNKDAQSLTDWLKLKLVRNSMREKTLRVQCRMSTGNYEVLAAPNREADVTRSNTVAVRGTNEIVQELHKSQDRKPTIVFCMKVDDTYELASSWIAGKQATISVSVPPSIDVDASLLKCLERRAAFHNAELGEDERLFVEEQIAAGKVDVVYATSTLAAGVNFPLGAAVFASWHRWNADKKAHEPIGRAEFQNMAGRVGRMGQKAAEGMVVFCAEGGTSSNAATKLMDMHSQDDLGHGIRPDDFGALALQMFAGKLCHSREDAFNLLSSTLSASREVERNASGVTHWKPRLDAQIDRLVAVGCLIETTFGISVTNFGTAVAQSGLKPETAIFFIQGLVRRASDLSKMLSDGTSPDSENDLAFILAHAALTSPEYGRAGGNPTRHIHWRATKFIVTNSYGTRLRPLLFEGPFEAYVGAANGALLIASWAAGKPRSDLERLVSGVRLGALQAMSQDVSWIISGVAEIVTNVTSSAMADESKPELLRGNGPTISLVRQLARGLRRQAARISSGLPTDVFWISALELPGRPRRLSRNQILALRQHGFIRPADLMDGSPPADLRRKTALDAHIDPRLANQVRDAAKTWKVNNREQQFKIHIKRAEKIEGRELVEHLYKVRGDALEGVFSDAMNFISVKCDKLDEKGRSGYPGFLLSIEDFPQIVVEIKSRQSDTDVVALNATTEVLAASEMIGMRDTFCLTVCSPGVEASVPGLIERCTRLCVVDVGDLTEAILRVREGRLPRAELYNWLTTPGIALMEDLPSPH